MKTNEEKWALILQALSVSLGEVYANEAVQPPDDIKKGLIAIFDAGYQAKINEDNICKTSST